jgi:hypothetical protein
MSSRSPLRRFSSTALALGLLTLVTGRCIADGLHPQWAENGVPVKPSPSSAGTALPYPDGTGGTYVVWLDQDATTHLRAHHLLMNGIRDPRWPADGIRVGEWPGYWFASTEPPGQITILVGSASDMRAVRILEDGTIPALWAPGVSLGGNNFVIATDPTGGMWSVRMIPQYSCIPNFPNHCQYWKELWAIRIDPTGSHVPGWEPPGKRISTLSDYVTNIESRNPHVVGGSLRFGFRYSANYGQYSAGGVCVIDAAGSTTLEPIFTGSDFASYDYASDETGNELVEYGDWPASALRGRGAVGGWWPATWNYPTSNITTWGARGVVSDYSGGGYVKTDLWATTSGATGRVLNHVLPAGGSDPAWPLTGIPIEGVGIALQSEHRTWSDGSGGCFVAWEDRRSGSDADVYALRFAKNSILPTGWPATGQPIAVVQGSDQSRPYAAADQRGNIFVIWRDARQGATNVYAQKLSADAPVPTQVMRASATLRDGRIELAWRLALAPEGDLTVERTTDGESWTELGIAVAGRARDEWVFTDGQPQRGVRHDYRLFGRATGWRGGEVSLETIESPPFSLAGLAPNPVTAASRIVLTLGSGASSELEVTDVLGRIVASRSVAPGEGGSVQLAWSELARLPAGLYWLRARQGEAERRARFVVTH